MTTHVLIPRNVYARQRPIRAVTRFYGLLDSGVIHAPESKFGGSVAINTVAFEYNVPAQTVWRWIRDYVDYGPLKFA
jgi:hypothetical protein